MGHEHLIKWGRGAFEKGFSLAHIENYLLKRGMKKQEALKALQEITAFEHKVRNEVNNTRKILTFIFIMFLLIISGIIFLYFAGIIKTN